MFNSPKKIVGYSSTSFQNWQRGLIVPKSEGDSRIKEDSQGNWLRVPHMRKMDDKMLIEFLRVCPFEIKEILLEYLIGSDTDFFLDKYVQLHNRGLQCMSDLHIMTFHNELSVYAFLENESKCCAHRFYGYLLSEKYLFAYKIVDNCYHFYIIEELCWDPKGDMHYRYEPSFPYYHDDPLFDEEEWERDLFSNYANPKYKHNHYTWNVKFIGKSITTIISVWEKYAKSFSDYKAGKIHQPSFF